MLSGLKHDHPHRKRNKFCSTFILQLLCILGFEQMYNEQELLTLPEHLDYPSVFFVLDARSCVFCVMFYRSLFVILSYSSWSWYCLSFFDLQAVLLSLRFLQTFLNFLEHRTVSPGFSCVRVVQSLTSYAVI
jgi:hypothetical protein